MSEYVVSVQLKVRSSWNGAQGARQTVESAIARGAREGLILSGTVTSEPEECVCLTASELEARIQAAIAEASTATTSKAPAGA